MHIVQCTSTASGLGGDAAAEMSLRSAHQRDDLCFSGERSKGKDFVCDKQLYKSVLGEHLSGFVVERTGESGDGGEDVGDVVDVDGIGARR